jgi:serine/threonine protein kinase
MASLFKSKPKVDINSLITASHKSLKLPGVSTLEDFNVLETLGTGTFGRVRLAQHRKTGTYFALKILKKHEVIRLKQVEHVLSERAILNEINHPFIVTMSAAFQDARNLYMTLEYVIGGELFSHLRKAGRFSNETTRFYTSQIILGLEHLHGFDIVYRDLKPENLLLDQQGYIKITDFGFAKKVEDRTWTLCGTPEYLAPEIIQSKGHGKAVDWWALGVLIYEMLSGYPPFYDENPFGIYQKILAGKCEYPKHMDPYAKDLIKKCVRQNAVLCTQRRFYYFDLRLFLHFPHAFRYRLLQPDRSKRFGNLKAGAADIREHKWFKGFDWQALVTRSMAAPIVPEVRSPGDTRNFDKYPDDDEVAPPPLDPRSKELFRDF